MISFVFGQVKNKEIDQTEQDNIHPSMEILYLQQPSLIIAGLVIPTCPAAHTHRSHEIEPPPRPTAANARGYAHYTL